MRPLMRYRVRKALRPLSFGPRHHRRDMEGCLRNMARLGLAPRTLIDVGVAHGTYELYRPFPDAALLLVEPMAEFEPSIKAICANQKKGASYRMVAAGDHSGNIDIYGAEHPGESSILPNEAQVKRTVPIVRLDDLTAELPKPFVLKIDVQGAEMAVMDGAVETMKSCDAVLLETALFDFSKPDNTIVQVISYMAARGFVPYDIYDGLLRPLDGALGQIDIAFVKAAGILRHSHVWGTAAQSKRHDMMYRARTVLGV